MKQGESFCSLLKDVCQRKATEQGNFNFFEPHAKTFPAILSNCLNRERRRQKFMKATILSFQSGQFHLKASIVCQVVICQTCFHIQLWNTN